MKHSLSTNTVGKIKANTSFYQKIGFAKLILSTGMIRSGSTLLFNILRLLLLSDRRFKLSAGWIGDIRNLPKGNTYLIKTHGFDRWKALRAYRIFYSYRDVRDALVSASRKFGTSPSLDKVRVWISEFEFGKANADLILRYEDMIADIPATIQKIADNLAINTSVEDVMSELPTKFDGNDSRDRYSKITLIHKDHVTGTIQGEWRTVLQHDLQDQINSEFEWWFEQNGYEKQ